MQFQLGAPVVTIRSRLRGFIEIDEALLPRRNLHAPVAEVDGPTAHAAEGVERRLIADKLREENSRTLDGIHGCSPILGVSRAICHGRGARTQAFTACRRLSSARPCSGSRR